MRLVVDANILFSIMKPDSTVSYLFAQSQLELFAPEYLKQELARHKSECISKAGLSSHEFEMRLAEIEERVSFFGPPKYKRFLAKSVHALPDPEDSPYLALALALKAGIWTSDPHLRKQSLAKVYSTEDLVRELFKDLVE